MSCSWAKIVEQKFQILKTKLATMVDEDISKMRRIKQTNDARLMPINHVIEVIDLLTDRVSDNNMLYARRYVFCCSSSRYYKCLNTLSA